MKMHSQSEESRVDVSVIMPVHNCQAYLADQLRALLAPTGLVLEILAVNDGSTDGSAEVLHQFRQEDPRLVVIEQNCQGPGAARNAGLREARGQYIAFADADDLMPIAALERWVNSARERDLDVLVGNAYRFRGDAEAAAKTPFFSRQPVDQVVTGQEWIRHCVASREWPHYVWLQLIRRDLVLQHRLAFHADILHEDVLWTTELALVALRMGFLQAPDYGYRRHDASVVFSPDPERRKLRGTSYVYIMEKLSKYTERPDVSSAARRALQKHLLHEAWCFVDLLRKDIGDTQTRADLARSFAAIRPWRSVLRGVRTMSDVRRAWLTYIRLRRLQA